MEILTKKEEGPSALYQITGIVKLDPEDDAQYCGHFSVDGLDQFVEYVKKTCHPSETCVIKVVFRKDLNSYIMVAIPTNEEHLKGAGIALQGHECGIDGKYEPAPEK